MKGEGVLAAPAGEKMEAAVDQGKYAKLGNVPAATASTQKEYVLDPVKKRIVPNKLESSDYAGQVVYRSPSVVELGAEAAPARSDGAAPALGLLDGHISSGPPWNPFDEGQIEVWEGAALVKVTKQKLHEMQAETEIEDEGENPAKETETGGKRGRVQEFSRSSRARMIKFLAKIRLSAENLPLFGTTTYPDLFPEDAKKFKRDIRVLIDRLKRRFPCIGLLWRLEFKMRRSGENAGKVAPHFHWLLWNVPRKFDFQPENGDWVKMIHIANEEWKIDIKHKDGDKFSHHVEYAKGQDRFTEWLSRNWYDVSGTGDIKHYHAGTNVKVLNSKREVFFYVSKYMGKIEAGMPCPFPGRFWGVVNPQNIPLGNRRVIKCTGKQAARMMRFLRHFIRSIKGKKPFFNSWSMSCVCNADFWAERIPKLLAASVPQI